MVPTTGQLKQLPVSERLELMENLWGSFEPEEVPMPQWQKDELDRRGSELTLNPGIRVSLEDAMKIITGTNGA